MESDSAAAKIQALQRGRQGRAAAAARREQRVQQSDAAAKIQALHRGHAARREAQGRREALRLFELPPVAATHDAVVVRASLDAIRRRPADWEEFVAAAREEIPAPAGLALDVGAALYATAGRPADFANAFGERAFAGLRELDECRVALGRLRREHTAAVAARPPPPVPAPRPAAADGGEEDEEDEGPRLTKKQRRELEAQQKEDRQRLKAIALAEHDAECRALRLRGVLQLAVLKIPLVQARE